MIRVGHILRVASGESAAAWSAALNEAAWFGSSQVLKEDSGSWVRRARVMGRDVVVKCRALNTVGRRVKHVLGMGHGGKHWRGAELLRRALVRTAGTILLARGRVAGGACELLVMEYLDGPTLLECLRDAATGRMAVKDQHAIARAVGSQMSKMGWNFNRDHKPSNLIVLGAENSTPEIAVIDCVGVRFRQVLKTERMLASLVIEPTGCGVPPRRSLMMRVIRSHQEELEKCYDPADEQDEFPAGPPETPRQRVRSLTHLEWRKAEAIVRSHSDPRPRVDPLKRASGG